MRSLNNDYLSSSIHIFQLSNKSFRGIALDGTCSTDNWACCACEDPSETCVNHGKIWFGKWHCGTLMMWEAFCMFWDAFWDQIGRNHEIHIHTKQTQHIELRPLNDTSKMFCASNGNTLVGYRLACSENTSPDESNKFWSKSCNIHSHKVNVTHWTETLTWYF